MTYSRTDYIRAWIRSLFGIVVAVIIFYVLQSFFLALLAFAFLFFIPMQRNLFERVFNGAFFGILMIIILFFAFGFGKITDVGLGLDLGVELEPIQYFFIFVLAISIIARSLLFIAASVTGFPLADALRRLARGARRNWFSTILTVLIALSLIALIAPPFGPLESTSLKPWTWKSSAIIFTGVWLLSFLGGVFSDVQSRQILGVIMILVSFVVFTLGIGSNIVGEATFGQWWPAVKEFGDITIVPVVNALSDFADSMKDAWRLITCPTCVVQDIIDGRFGKDPDSGLSGALGVEFVKHPRATPVFPYTDYSITTEIKNQGSSEAKNVLLKIIPGEKVPEKYSFNPFNKDKITLPELAFDKNEIERTGTIGNLSKQESKRLEFLSNEQNQLSCETINKYQLESKVVPLIVELQYDYKVSSRIEVEVFDKTKWEEEIVRKGKVTEERKPSEMTNSPVKLNMDIGEQPKLEGKTDFITLELKEAKDGVGIKNVSRIVLHYPKELKWIKARACKGSVEGPGNTIVWEAGKFPKTNTVNCHFEYPTLSVPSTTFQFSAEAEYTASTFKGFDEKIQWKRGCCSERVCDSNEKCSWKSGQKTVGSCEEVSGGSGDKNFTELRGEPDYCDELIKQTNSAAYCDVGAGGCTKTDQCRGLSSATFGDLKCREAGPNVPVKICCYQNAPDDVCERFYGDFLRG